jgi:hypothetical protein
MKNAADGTSPASFRPEVVKAQVLRGNPDIARHQPGSCFPPSPPVGTLAVKI